METITINIVGPKNPCKRCRKTKSIVEQVVNKNFSKSKKNKVEIEHVDVSAPATIEQFGVLETPAVIVNNTVVSEGGIPDIAYIKEKLLNI